MQQTEGLRRTLAQNFGQGSAVWAMQRSAERLPAEFPVFGLEPGRAGTCPTSSAAERQDDWIESGRRGYSLPFRPVRHYV